MGENKKVKGDDGSGSDRKKVRSEDVNFFFFSSRRPHYGFSLGAGVSTCSFPISFPFLNNGPKAFRQLLRYCLTIMRNWQMEATL